MNETTQKKFEIIFQEAHVVDVDFSKWDKWIRLVVVAGLMPGNFNGYGNLHNIDFMSVAEWSWKANHLDVVLDSPEHHCQWVIMDFCLERGDKFNVISLISVAPPCPDLKITCKDVEITELSTDAVDTVNPNWNTPYQPLARPSFQELLLRVRH